MAGLGRSHRNLLLLALGVAGLRVVVAASIPLTEDEAYYRLWAQHLQLGYLDHPPMIAWWIRAGEALFGDTPLGVRLVAALASGLTTWLVGDLTERLGASRRTAWRAAFWYNATLTMALGGMLAIPDAPASLFWTLTLWALAHFWERGRATWWLVAGAAAGLAVLSKYSGLFLAPGVLLWLIAIPGGRAELRKPGPWEAAVLAAFIFAANVVWNSEHGWITFEKQFGRVAAHGFTPGRLAELIGGQILLFTPLMAVYAGLGVRQAWRERQQPGAVHLMLPVATAAPFAAYLVVHSLHDRVQAHWPAPLFAAFAICAAVAAERSGSAVWRRLTPAIGLAVAAGAFVLVMLPTPTLLGRFDPTLAVRGWPRFAQDVEQVRAATGAAWVATESYGTYAQLNKADRIKAPLLEEVERDRYWPTDPHPDFSRPGLVVDLARRMKVVDVQRCYARVAPVAELARAGGPGRNQRYSAFLVAGPRRDVWIQGCPDEIAPGVWR